MKGRTSGLVTLVGPSRNTWHVELIQQNDDLFLHQGWSAFVRDHFIECGDFLVFRYDSQLHFTVDVFDQSACEKEAAFQSKCSQDSSSLSRGMGQKRGREEPTSPSDKIFEGVPKKLRGSYSQHYLETLSSNKTKQGGSPMKNSDIPFQAKPVKEKQGEEVSCLFLGF